MKPESLEKIKQKLISHFEKVGPKDYIVIGHTTYTGNDLVCEITDETEVGLGFIERLLLLTVDLISRDKI